MKHFLKTLGRGIAVLFASFMSVILIAASCVDFFVQLPTKTGLAAVGIFVLAVIRFLIGGVTIYFLGDMMGDE